MQFIGAAILGWFIAQLIKIIKATIKNKKIVPYSFIASGGMPSSHTSTVVSLTTKVGIDMGVNTIYFAICAVFSLIVMYDSVGVRRAVGLQGQKINQLIDEYELEESLKNKKLGEILGHTPSEVLGGLVLGIAVGFIV